MADDFASERPAPPPAATATPTAPDSGADDFSSDRPVTPAGKTSPFDMGKITMPTAGQTADAMKNLAASRMTDAQKNLAALKDPKVMKVVQMALRQEPGVDYRGIPNASLRANFSFQRNDDEKKAYLDNTVGAGNYRKDQYGAWVVEPKGLAKLGIKSDKPMSIGSNNPNDRYRMYDYSNEVLPTLGMVAGGLATGGMGPAAALALAALGGGAGEAGNALYNQARGTNRLTAGQEAANIALSAAESSAGEGAARVVPAAARLATGGFGSAEKRAAFDAAKRLGFTPTFEQGLEPTTLPLIQREQGIGFQYFGNPQAKKNTEIAVRNLTNHLVRAGVPLQEARGIALRAGQGLVDTSREGVSLTEGAKGYSMSLDKDIDTLTANAKKITDDSLKQVNAQIDKADPFLYQNIGQNVQEAKKTFMGHARQLYVKVDEVAQRAKDIIGTDRIIPTSRLKLALQKVQNQYPDTWGEIVKDAGVKQTMDTISALPKRTTARDMQVLREQLADAAGSGKFVGSSGNAVAEIFRRAADSTFDAARKLGGYSGEAARALRKADQFYAEGIDAFKLPEINTMMKEARQTGRVDPENAVRFITDPAHPTRMGNIIKLVTPETRRAIGTALWQNMVANSTDEAGLMSGRKLLGLVTKYQPHMQQLYGNKIAADMLDAARKVAAYDRVIPPEVIGGDMGRVMKDIADKEAERDQFLKTNYLSELAKPGFSSERAIEFVAQDKSAERVRMAKQLFGADSPQWQNIRAGAMQHLVANIYQRDPVTSGLDAMNGTAFNDALKGMGDRTLESLFGKEQTKDLHDLGNALQLLSKQQRKAGSVAAGSATMHILKHKWDLAYRFLVGRFMARPGVVKLLVVGMRPGPRAKEALDALEALYKAEAYTHAAPGRGDQTGALYYADPEDQSQ